jgi:hypothetical protein
MPSFPVLPEMKAFLLFVLVLVLVLEIFRARMGTGTGTRRVSFPRWSSHRKTVRATHGCAGKMKDQSK